MSIEEIGSAPSEGFVAISPLPNKLPLFSFPSSVPLNEVSSSFTLLDTLSGKTGLATQNTLQTEDVFWDVSRGCKNPYVVILKCNQCGKIHRVRFGCGKRFSHLCPECSRAYQKKMVKDFTYGFYWMKNPKLLTLTLKKQGGFDALDNKLWKLFHDLRRILLDEYGIRIECFEGVIEYPNHVHVIMDARYIPFKTIQKIWRQLTQNQSYFVNIKAIKVRSHSRVVRYLTKYVSKMESWNVVPAEQLKHFRIRQSWKVEKVPPCPSICHEGHVVVYESARHDEDWTRQAVPSSPGPPGPPYG